MRCLAFILVLTMASVAPAQPATQPGNLIRTSAARTAANNSGAVLDTSRVLISLAIVLSAIFILRWVIKRFFHLPAAVKSSDAIRILSRTAISPRQHVLALQVGKRVLLIADNGQQLSTLCELSEREDVQAFTGCADDEQEDQPIAQRAVRDELRGLLTKVKVLSQQFR